MGTITSEVANGPQRGAEGDSPASGAAMRAPLRAPFPWFGGKGRAAGLIWSRLGDTANYVEPFAGSLAVLLARPHAARIETVNDKDAYLANFWRAVRDDPEAVAMHADWPVSECDLEARHRWLVTTGAERLERLRTDAEWSDARVAGWWVWGLCQWIGSGWCAAPHRQLPHLGSAGRGVYRKRPHLGNAGMGVHCKRPHLSDAGTGVHRPTDTTAWMAALAARLRRVRVCCGDWTRVMGPSVTERRGVAGIVLDPPYGHAEREDALYRVDEDVAAAVAAWAKAHGDNPLLRIALCGYDGEHDMPPSWEAVRWQPHGGYGSQGNGRGRANARREVIWFSPACLRPDRQGRLWADDDSGAQE